MRPLVLVLVLVGCARRPAGGDPPTGERPPPYAGEGHEIERCDPAALPADPFEVSDVAFVDDALEVTVVHGGGCADHAWYPCWDGTFMESWPVQARLALGHDARGDLCKALVTRVLRLDPAPLLDAYRDAYGADGPIVVHVREHAVRIGPADEPGDEGPL